MAEETRTDQVQADHSSTVVDNSNHLRPTIDDPSTATNAVGDFRSQSVRELIDAAVDVEIDSRKIKAEAERRLNANAD